VVFLFFHGKEKKTLPEAIGRSVKRIVVARNGGAEDPSNSSSCYRKLPTGKAADISPRGIKFPEESPTSPFCAVFSGKDMDTLTLWNIKIMMERRA